MGWDAQVEDRDERGVGRVVNRADRRLYSRWGGVDRGGLVNA